MHIYDIKLKRSFNIANKILSINIKIVETNVRTF